MASESRFQQNKDKPNKQCHTAEDKNNPMQKCWPLPSCDQPGHFINKFAAQNCCWYNIERNINHGTFLLTLIKTDIENDDTDSSGDGDWVGNNDVYQVYGGGSEIWVLRWWEGL